MSPSRLARGRRWGFGAAVLLGACSGKGEPPEETGAPDTAPYVAPGCGDGVVDADEACDDGAENSDTAADACRTSCLAPSCGDAVVDDAEACDDGETWGGDGCSAACGIETGALEAEPNDAWDAANAGATLVHGALPEGDLDCWTVDVPACGAVQAVQQGPCGVGLSLDLHRPDGALVAVGSAGADGCAALDPAEQPGARWIAEGTWSVCTRSLSGAEVRGYSLVLSTPDPATLDAPAPADDLDADAVPDGCDPDEDGDGLVDDEDNCPRVSNGPDTPVPALSAAGFVRTWLVAGPYTGAGGGSCRPSDTAHVGEDGSLAPSLGAAAGEGTWAPDLLTVDTLDLLIPFGSVPAPREAYAATWLWSPSARALTLSVGADDGFYAWWNGARVFDVSSCQGVVADQFQVGVDVAEGWNLLVTKVYDQGGGWGLAARFFDGDGAVVTDLVPALVPEEGWRPDQSDTDGDGVGDVCE